MSFMDLLKEAREEVKNQSGVKEIFEEVSANSDDFDLDTIFKKADPEEKEHEETKAPQPVEPPEQLLSIGDAIVQTSTRALKSKLKGTGAARRLAKAISVRRHITTDQLKKAFTIQSRVKPAHINFNLVGGKPMKQLKDLLDKGATLGAALDTLYKD